MLLALRRHELRHDPRLQDPIKDLVRLTWHEVKKVDHSYLSVDAMTGPMTISETEPPRYRGHRT